MPAKILAIMRGYLHIENVIATILTEEVDLMRRFILHVAAFFVKNYRVPRLADPLHNRQRSRHFRYSHAHLVFVPPP